MEITKSIKIFFKIDTERGPYQDALYFTEAESKALKPADIEAMARARADDWVNFLKNPPPVSEPTKEELQELYDANARLLASITQQNEELLVKINQK